MQPPTPTRAAPRSALRRRVGLCAAATLVLGTSTLWGAAPATADDNPTAVPSASPPVEVDANSPGLMLGDGATLGDIRVLDIKSVVEDLGGEERREDTNVDITFALQAEVLFGKDSAKLSGEANARITAIAEEIRNQKAAKVRVFGFTDDLGSEAHGDVLSKKRADAVSGVLSPGLPSVTFEIRGYGEDYPIADNKTEEGRKKNRRVEVTFQRAGAS
ncbi:OmpA family protein [Streptomyces sp. NPDC102441]|uniref:OmpA family protein n=1 Tax=Streptomyces sp. NPDC102441 TaxID=3366176 RepID=UPI003805547D